MKILTIQLLAIVGVLVCGLSFAIAYSLRENDSDNSIQENSNAIESQELRYILAKHLTKDKESVSRVYATQCDGDAMVWNAKASFSYRAPSDDAKEMDSASWEVISKLLSRHLKNLSRDEVGTYAPSHHIYVNAEFCQIKIPVYRSGDPGSYDLVGELMAATGGSKGMNWNPISGDSQKETK